MRKGKNPKKEFENITKKIAIITQSIENILPEAIIKETTSFGNSSHVVLSKELLNKKVGVIVFGNKVMDAQKIIKRR